MQFPEHPTPRMRPLRCPGACYRQKIQTLHLLLRLCFSTCSVGTGHAPTFEEVQKCSLDERTPPVFFLRWAIRNQRKVPIVVANCLKLLLQKCAYGSQASLPEPPTYRVHHFQIFHACPPSSVTFVENHYMTPQAISASPVPLSFQFRNVWNSLICISINKFRPSLNQCDASTL